MLRPGLAGYQLGSALLGSGRSLLPFLGRGRGLRKPAEKRAGEKHQVGQEQTLMEPGVPGQSSVGLAQRPPLASVRSSAGQGGRVRELPQGSSCVLRRGQYEDAAGFLNQLHDRVRESASPVHRARVSCFSLLQS